MENIEVYMLTYKSFVQKGDQISTKENIGKLLPKAMESQKPTLKFGKYQVKDEYRKSSILASR